MKMKLYVIGMLMVLCLSGCNKTPSMPESDLGVESGSKETEQESTEILNPPNGEIHYTETELQIVEDELGNHENAQEIMKQLNYFGIYNITKAELLVAGEEEELMVETSDHRNFVIHYYSDKHHIHAIEKDGEYIYFEYE